MSELLLNPSDGEPCPCGSKKKWKRCHGSTNFEEQQLVGDRNADPTLRGLAGNAIAILQDAIESLPIDKLVGKPTSEEVEREFRKRTLLYFARKLHRSTLAGVSLVRLGQTSVAFTLKRDQHYAWVAFNYYYDSPRESVLFTASGPLRQRDSAVKMMDFQKIKDDKERQNQLGVLFETAEELYKEFPDLRRPKGKSGGTKSPDYIDWSEPSTFDMFKAIVTNWANELEKQGKSFPNNYCKGWIERETREGHFFHDKFPSQDIHGTPLGLVADLPADDDEGEVENKISIGRHDPNTLLYIYSSHPLNVAFRLVELSGAPGFTDRFAKLEKALKRWIDYFNRI